MKYLLLIALAMSSLSATLTEGKTYSCEMQAKDTSDPYTMTVAILTTDVLLINQSVVLTYNATGSVYMGTGIDKSPVVLKLFPDTNTLDIVGIDPTFKCEEVKDERVQSN